MSRARPLRIAALLAWLLFVSCTTPLGELTVLAPEALPSGFLVISAEARGEECTLQLLGLSPIAPSVSDAVNAALASAPGADALADATIATHFRFYGLASEICVSVRGKAIATR